MSFARVSLVGNRSAVIVVWQLCVGETTLRHKFATKEEAEASIPALYEQGVSRDIEVRAYWHYEAPAFEVVCVYKWGRTIQAFASLHEANAFLHTVIDDTNIITVNIRNMNTKQTQVCK